MVEEVVDPAGADRWVSDHRPGHTVPVMPMMSMVDRLSGASLAFVRSAYPARDESAPWVIVGGESGPAARPMLVEWAREVRDQCRAARVPFFFKQWGGLRPKSGGRHLDGREWNQLPKVRRVIRKNINEAKDGSAENNPLAA